MSTKSLTVSVLAIVAALLVFLGPLAAQDRPGMNRPTMGKEVTLSGQVVDLHCFMTGQFPSADRAKCTADCIRSGVPAALSTDSGVYVLGQGPTGPAKALTAHAFQNVDIVGKVFEKGGVRYVDITSITPANDDEPADQD